MLLDAMVITRMVLLRPDVLISFVHMDTAAPLRGDTGEASLSRAAAGPWCRLLHFQRLSCAPAKSTSCCRCRWPDALHAADSKARAGPSLHPHLASKALANVCDTNETELHFTSKRTWRPL